MTSEHEKFIEDQLLQLEQQGHAPMEAAEIMLQSQKAIIEACRKLLEDFGKQETSDGKQSG